MNRAGTHLNSSTGTHAYPRGIKTNLLSRRRPSLLENQHPCTDRLRGRRPPTHGKHNQRSCGRRDVGLREFKDRELVDNNDPAFNDIRGDEDNDTLWVTHEVVMVVGPRSRSIDKVTPTVAVAGYSF